MRRVLAASAVVALLTLGFASPAAAHGALSSPASRAVMCGDGTQAQMTSAACKAAVAAGADVGDWDNIRVAGVNGRDRQVIPDGKLCSGGLDKYKGLDLPRSDWPTTKVSGGAAFTFAYQERIPHQGTFRIYVTKNGYDPAHALRWSDLESAPFLTVTDPKIQNGAYRMKGTLPAKSGRQIIYAIWQTSSTPDTYYSCSDVVFGSAPKPPSKSPAAKSAPAAPPSAPAAAAPPAAQAALNQAGSGEPTPSLVPKAAQTSLVVPNAGLLIAVVGVVIALAVAGTTVAMRRRRR